MESNRKRRGRGEGGVRYDEKRGLWVASVSLGYFPDGRRNRPVAYGESKREALDGLDRLRRENAARVPTEAARMTVGEMLDLWLSAKKDKVALGTHEGRELAAADVREALGGEVAAKLTPLRVARWHEEMARAGAAPSARHHAARALIACLGHAVTLGVLPANPAKPAGVPAAPEREMQVLSPAQTKALLASSVGYVIRPFLCVALGSGIRQGEQLGLQWPDLDLGAGSLSVRRALVRTKGEGLRLKRTKTRAARRTVSLPAFAVEALRAHREGHRNDPPTWTVFCGPGGSHRLSASLRKVLRDAIARANRRHAAAIPDGLHWHDLRHTHASLLLSAGHSIRAVSARLGHTDPAFTLRVYGHLMPGDDLRLAEGMQAILG